MDKISHLYIRLLGFLLVVLVITEQQMSTENINVGPYDYSVISYNLYVVR